MADTRGYVYVIGWAKCGPVKIGRSTAPRTRLKGLQTSIPHTLQIYFAIRLNDYALLEARCHALLSKSRIRGEWFNATPGRVAAMLKAEANKIDKTHTLWCKAPNESNSRSRDAEAISEWQYLNR